MDAPERTPRKLWGFRSGEPWKSVCVIGFFCALYLAFVLTLMPPIIAGAHDQLVYKAVRACLFAAAVLPVLFLSDFTWCARLPFFSSPRTSQRVLGTAVLAALLVCLGANLMYLHTPEYRTELTRHVTSAFGIAQEETPASVLTTNEESAAQEEAPQSGTSDGTKNVWTDRHEGCGTD